MEPTLWKPPAELSYQDRIRGGYDRKRSPKAPPGHEYLGSLLDPLDDHPELWETLQRHIGNNLNRQRTARFVHIHPNTIDHRLKRVAAFSSRAILLPDGSESPSSAGANPRPIRRAVPKSVPPWVESGSSNENRDRLRGAVRPFARSRAGECSTVSARVRRWIQPN